MRTALILAATLVANALLAGAAGAATASSDPYNDVQQMRAAFSQIHSVQLIERFGSGEVATVQFVPSNKPGAVMAADNPNDALREYVRQPGGDPYVDLRKLFTITSLGTHAVNGEQLAEYSLVALDGSGSETIWVNAHHLPVKAHIQAGTQTVDVMYGNYDVPIFFATKP